MTSIGVRELRQDASRWLREVEDGGDVVVTRHGRPVARLVPIGATDGVEALLAEGQLTQRPAPLSALPPKVDTRRGSLADDVVDRRAHERVLTWAVAWYVDTSALVKVVHAERWSDEVRALVSGEAIARRQRSSAPSCGEPPTVSARTSPRPVDQLLDGARDDRRGTTWCWIAAGRLDGPLRSPRRDPPRLRAPPWVTTPSASSPTTASWARELPRPGCGSWPPGSARAPTRPEALASRGVALSFVTPVRSSGHGAAVGPTGLALGVIVRSMAGGGLAGLVECRADDVGRLRAGQPDAAVEDEERHAGDAEVTEPAARRRARPVRGDPCAGPHEPRPRRVRSRRRAVVSAPWSAIGAPSEW